MADPALPDWAERRRLPLNALRAFEAVALHGSVTAGAAALTVTQSAASRHIAKLEEQLGCKLLVRRAQGVVVTEEGRRLLAGTSEAFDRISLAIEDTTVEREVRIFVTPAFMRTFAAPLIMAWRSRFPHRRIVLLSDKSVGQKRLDVDLAITFDVLSPDPRERPQLLWPISLTPACAPALAQRLGTGSLADLLAITERLHVRIDGRPDTHLWNTFLSGAGLKARGGSDIVLETMGEAMEIARAGLGVTLLDTRLVPRLDMFGLVAPFDLSLPIGHGYFLWTSPFAQEDPAVAALCADIRDLARTYA